MGGEKAAKADINKSAKAGVEESKRPKGKGGGKGGEGKAVKYAKGKGAKSGKDANPSTPPSKNPTADPTNNPTAGPTKNPTADPTWDPTAGPTGNPFMCAAGFVEANSMEYLNGKTQSIPPGDTAENLDACWEAVSNFGNVVGVYWNFVMGTCRAIVDLSVFSWRGPYPDDQNRVKLCFHLPSIPI